MDWYIKVEDLTIGQLHKLCLLEGVEAMDTENSFGSFNGVLDFWWQGCSKVQISTWDEVLLKLKDRGLDV